MVFIYKTYIQTLHLLSENVTIEVACFTSMHSSTRSYTGVNWPEGTAGWAMVILSEVTINGHALHYWLFICKGLYIGELSIYKDICWCSLHMKQNDIFLKSLRLLIKKLWLKICKCNEPRHTFNGNFLLQILYWI